MDLAKASWIYAPARCICKHLEGAVLRTSKGPTSSWASAETRRPEYHSSVIRDPEFSYVKST